MNKLIGCFIFLIGFAANLFPGIPADKSKLVSAVLSIDDIYLQKWGEEHVHKKELDKKVYKVALFTRLKEGQTQFAYYLLGQPVINKEYKTCLIYEYYDSEMAVWLVNYSFQNKVIDYLQIFYDNAEGAWQTISVLNKKTQTIQLKEYDAYADPEMKTQEYKISLSGKIEKISK